MVTALFATAVKSTIFFSMVRLFNYIIIEKPVLVIVCIMSLTIGILGALKTEKIKRFLAYVAINQRGFILLGIFVYIICDVMFFFAFFHANLTSCITISCVWPPEWIAVLNLGGLTLFTIVLSIPFFRIPVKIHNLKLRIKMWMKKKVSATAAKYLSYFYFVMLLVFIILLPLSFSLLFWNTNNFAIVVTSYWRVFLYIFIIFYSYFIFIWYFSWVEPLEPQDITRSIIILTIINLLIICICGASIIFIMVKLLSAQSSFDFLESYLNTGYWGLNNLVVDVPGVKIYKIIGYHEAHKFVYKTIYFIHNSLGQINSFSTIPQSSAEVQRCIVEFTNLYVNEPANFDQINKNFGTTLERLKTEINNELASNLSKAVKPAESQTLKVIKIVFIGILGILIMSGINAN